MNIYDFRKSNFINPTMNFEEIKNFANELSDEEDFWDLFGP